MKTIKEKHNLRLRKKRVEESRYFTTEKVLSLSQKNSPNSLVAKYFKGVMQSKSKEKGCCVFSQGLCMRHHLLWKVYERVTFPGENAV